MGECRIIDDKNFIFVIGIWFGENIKLNCFLEVYYYKCKII